MPSAISPARSVLVVDDDHDLRALVSDIVRSWGHAVIEAGSVAEALERARAASPDTVLADVHLPDGDGFELTRRLISELGPMRVVLISSDASIGAGGAAERAGALGLFAKAELNGSAVRAAVRGEG